MGGTSASRNAVFANRNEENVPVSFDLQSSQGLTEVLKAGKDVLTNPGEYAELRNLVLRYAQRGGDHDLKQKIETIIATFKAKKKHNEEELREKEIATEESRRVEETQTLSHGNVYALSGRRRLPKFTQKEPSEKQGEVSHTDNSKIEIIDTPTNVPPKATEPVHETVVKITSVPPSPKQQPEVMHQEISEPKSLETYKARIAEIKRLVHECVGNPAALVGAHDTVGKTYMVALLTALKATGAGGSENTEEAMQALETAYKTLISDSEHENTEQKPLVEEKVVVPIKKPELQTPQQVSVEKKVIEKPHANPVPIQSVPVAVVAKNTETHSIVAEKLPKPETQTPIEKQPETPTKVPGTFSSLVKPFKKKIDIEKKVVKTVFEKSDFAARDTNLGYTSQSEVESLEDTAVSELDGVGITKHTLRKLGTQPLETVEEEIGVHPKEVAVRQSELFTPEITEALGTLLHEWSTFSSSGLFGIGPGGPEHPLYRSLAPLSMGEVISGRWEGTNPKVQKAIKEYIDAWRHEQGVTYTINETFEHYLRRVVQKILKRQNQ